MLRHLILLLLVLPAGLRSQEDWRQSYEAGLAQVQSNQLAAAKISFAKAVSANPGFLPARKNLATVLWFLDEREASEKAFREILKTHPAEKTAHLYVGLAEYGRRRYAAAKTHLLQSGDLADSNPEVLPILAEVYLATSDDRGWQAVRTRLPSDAATQLRVARLALEYGKASEAKERLEKLLKDDPREEVWLTLAEAEDRLQAPEKALAAYRQALEVGHHSEQACVSASGFALGHGNAEYALEIIGRCLADRPRSAMLLLMKGLVTAQRGDRGAAEQLFSEAMAIDPKWPLPLLALGVSQLEGGGAEAATATFAKASTLAPNDSTALYLLGTGYSRGGNQLKAIAALEKATALAPGDARIQAGLGQAYATDGQTQKAIAALEKATKLDPHLPQALYQLGIAYRKIGRAEEARRVLARFQADKDKGRAEESEMVQILKVIGRAPVNR
ncbi:MAG: tetratricopeptide repeat protein [Bryobacteraceae bacterium]